MRSGAVALLAVATVLAGCASGTSDGGVATGAVPPPAGPSGGQAGGASWSPGPAAGASAGDWPTYHRTPDRAGAGPAASPADPARARLDWTSEQVDGAVYAEPLVDQGRVVVATEGGSLYGLDLASGRRLWRRHVSDPVTGDLPCGDVLPLGITGTPAIDPATHTVYAVTEKLDNQHLLAAVDDRTGDFLWQRVIDPPGSEPRYQQQRAALLVANGHVYVALGGRFGDCGDYHGWVVGVGLDGGGPLLAYQVPSRREAGIWAASGIAADGQGRLYAATGNGASEDTFDHGNAVIRLDPTLHEEDVFAPSGWARLNADDIDLGSTGPLLLDAGLLAVAGKDGRLWVLHAGHLGGVGGQVSSTPVGGPAFGGLAASGSTVLVPCADGLRAVRVSDSGAVIPLWRGPVTGPAIVAGGLAWALDDGGTGLHAFDLGSGRQLVGITVGRPARFATPAAAPGLILVAAERRVVAVATG